MHPADLAFTTRSAVTQPRVLLAGARVVLVLAGTPLLVFPFAWAAWVALVLAGFSKATSPDVALRRVGSAGEVAVGNGALRLRRGGSVREFALSSVRGGWLEPWRDGLAAVIDLGSRRLMIAVDDDTQGMQLLEAAGVGPAQQVLRVPLGSRAVLSGQGTVFHLLGPVLLVLMAFGPAVAFFDILGDVLRTGAGWQDLAVFGGVLLAVMVIGLGLGWMLVPGEASVGRDGVALRRLWNRRFFPFARVKGAVTTEHGVSLECEDGPIQLPTATFFANESGPREALARRIRDAMASWAAADSPAGLLPLERRGLSITAWRDALAGSLGRSDYRSVGAEQGDLVQLLEAPTTPLEQRVGAALALGVAPLDPEVKLRVRAAIDSSAHEPSRDALQHALDGDLDDALLMAALDASARSHGAR